MGVQNGVPPAGFACTLMAIPLVGTEGAAAGGTNPAALSPQASAFRLVPVAAGIPPAPSRFSGFPFPACAGQVQGIDVEKVRVLGQRVHNAMNSLKALRSFGIEIPYPDNVLCGLFDELRELHRDLTSNHGAATPEGAAQAANLYSARYYLQAPPPGGTSIPDDATTLYNAAATPSPVEVVHAFRTSLVTSPLVETTGFAEENFSQDSIFVALGRHALLVANDGIDALMADYISLFPENREAIPRIRLKNQGAGKVKALTDDEIIAILLNAYKLRPRVWDYDPETKRRTEGSLHSVRPINRYYGYGLIRSEIGRHFATFVNGNAVPPLLLEGPSGVGKTEMPKSYFQLLTANHPDLMMIRLPSTALPRLAEVVEAFKAKPGKFIVVIDDVGIATTDEEIERQWKPFRDVYEGAVSKGADNILLVISTNGRFPANVRSRGKMISLPNISDSREGKITAMGIIAEYFKAAKEAGRFEGDVELFTKFVTHDYYGGEAFPELTKLIGKPVPHGVEMSPRGLINHYLPALVSSGRINLIRDRISAHHRKLKELEEARKKPATVTQLPRHQEAPTEDAREIPQGAHAAGLTTEFDMADGRIDWDRALRDLSLNDPGADRKKLRVVPPRAAGKAPAGPPPGAPEEEIEVVLEPDSGGDDGKGKSPGKP